jgi:hypothetical protein
MQMGHFAILQIGGAEHFVCFGTVFLRLRRQPFFNKQAVPFQHTHNVVNVDAVRQANSFATAVEDFQSGPDLTRVVRNFVNADSAVFFQVSQKF